MKKMAFICVLLTTFTGCNTIAENRKVEITQRGTAPVASGDAAKVAGGVPTLWWRLPYTANRSAHHPMDAFVPQPTVDPLTVEMEFFENNAVKWPKKMRPAYNPRPALKKKPAKPVKKGSEEDAALRERLKRPITPRKSEVY